MNWGALVQNMARTNVQLNSTSLCSLAYDYCSTAFN